jgi:hypothetical protein
VSKNLLNYGDYAALDIRAGPWLRWLRQAGALALIGIFIIGVVNHSKAALGIVPQSAETRFSNDVSVIPISNPSHYIEFGFPNTDISNSTFAKRTASQPLQGHALSSFQNYWRFLSKDFLRIVWVEHRKGWFFPIKNIAEEIDYRPGWADVGNENAAMDFFVGNKLERFALHKVVKARWMPDGYLTNNNSGPLRRNELIPSEINRLKSKPSLDASTNCQDNREGRNNDGSDGGSEFRRPIHWDSFTFYTTLGGLLSFAAIYAGILLYITRDRRQ